MVSGLITSVSGLDKVGDKHMRAPLRDLKPFNTSRVRPIHQFYQISHELEGL
jgi:hypothetical protein